MKQSRSGAKGVTVPDGSKSWRTTARLSLDFESRPFVRTESTRVFAREQTVVARPAVYHAILWGRIGRRYAAKSGICTREQLFSHEKYISITVKSLTRIEPGIVGSNF